MAYVLNDIDNEEEQQQGPKEGPQKLTEGSGVITSDLSGPTQQNAPGASTAAPDVSTVNRIRDINRDQATQLANNLAQFEVDTQTGKYNTTAQGIRDQATQNISQNTYNLDDDLKSFIGSSLQSPDQVKNDDLVKFGNIRDNVYGGQSGLTSAQTAQLEAQRKLGEERIAGLDTIEGRKTALSDLYKSQMQGRAPTAGTVNFDEMILQNNEGATQAFNQAKTNYGTKTESERSGLASTITSQAEAAKAANKASSDYLQQRYGETNQAFQDRINKAVADKQSAYNDDKALLEDFLKNYENVNLDQSGKGGTGPKYVKHGAESPWSGNPDYLAALEDLGITREQLEQLIAAEKDGTNIDLSKYATITDPNINANTVASAEDRAYYTALQQLMQRPDQFLNAPGEAGGGIDFNWNQALADASVKPPQTDMSGFTPSYDENGNMIDENGNVITDLNAYMMEREQGRIDSINNTRNEALAGAASGAATGAQIGSVIPVIGNVVGGIIGAAVGFLANGGVDVIKNDMGLNGGTMEDAWANGDYGRLLGNPFGPDAAIAAGLGLDSDTFLAKSLDPIGTLFGSGDTGGTKDMKAWEKSPTEMPGRVMNETQLGGASFNVWKKYTKAPVMQDMAQAFGIGGNFGNKGNNAAFSRAIEGFIDAQLQKFSQAVEADKAANKIPKDFNLASLDGQKIFNQLILPELNKFIESKTGKKNSVIADAGSVEKMMADITDYRLYKNYNSAAPATAPASSAPRPPVRTGGGGGGSGRQDRIK